MKRKKLQKCHLDIINTEFDADFKSMEKCDLVDFG
jgi:hypothetical protein